MYLLNDISVDGAHACIRDHDECHDLLLLGAPHAPMCRSFIDAVIGYAESVNRELPRQRSSDIRVSVHK
jgi:hypothetical protein